MNKNTELNILERIKSLRNMRELVAAHNPLNPPDLLSIEMGIIRDLQEANASERTIRYAMELLDLDNILN